jgi:HD-GYP domain-containing protein (c-di-GMP phosphodiesterase class II)
MPNTQELLEKIAALRQRLDQAQGLARAAGSVAAALEQHKGHGLQGPHFRERGRSWNEPLLDRTLRQLPDAVNPAEDQAVFPSKLTARGFRVVKQGRDLLDALRSLGQSPRVAGDDAGPLACYYRQTVAMIDSVLRMVQAFPEAPSAQYRLCEGLEIILNGVGQRLAALQAALTQRQEEDSRTHALANLLTALVQGTQQSLQEYRAIAQKLLGDAESELPLSFQNASAEHPALFVAAHSLNVAQVIARLVQCDPQWQERREQVVFAALLHDVGMLKMPAEVLACPGPLDNEQRCLMETHTLEGADLVRRLADSDSWLVEAAASHHERIDGTGYPSGLLNGQFSSLVQLLSVCDVYAAMCADRPYRAALETRTALTDTLLVAEQGALNRFEAEKLLHLGFYPRGSIIELADGPIGVVVAAGPEGRVPDPARPTIMVFFERVGVPLTTPRQIDLTQEPTRTVLRTLPAEERYRLFSNIFPVLV